MGDAVTEPFADIVTIIVAEIDAFEDAEGILVTNGDAAVNDAKDSEGDGTMDNAENTAVDSTEDREGGTPVDTSEDGILVAFGDTERAEAETGSGVRTLENALPLSLASPLPLVTFVPDAT